LDSQNIITWAGQDRKDRTGLPAQHCQGSTVRTEYLEQDRTARKGKPEHDSPKVTIKQDRKMMACTSELPGQTAST
jgi:hypothetical protein